MVALNEACPASDARGQAGWGQGSVAIGGSEPDGERTAARAGRGPAIGGGRNPGERLDGPSPDPDRVRAADGLAGRVDGGARVAATLNSGGNDGGFRTEPGEHIVSGHFGVNDDPLLPIGIDSRRYKAIGNGVVAPVAEWIGLRLRRYLEHASS